MLAATQGDTASAKGIFAAIEQERPEAPMGYVGVALANLFRGRSNEAILSLGRGLKAVSAEDQPSLQALLGLALRMDGRTSESIKAFEAAGDVPMAQAMLSRGAKAGLSPRGG